MEKPFEQTAYNLLLRNWPQYEQLRQECLKFVHRKSFSTGKVDCFVDLNNYLSVLYDKPDCIFDESFCLVSSILNFAAHLIYFFNSRFSQYTSVYLVWGTNRPPYIGNAEYNAHNQQKINVNPQITQIINESLSMLDTLVKYIPDTYLVCNDIYEPAVLMRGIIKANNLKNPRFIFSRDMYDFQLAAIVPNTHIIRTKKTMNGDKTFTISYFDFFKKINYNMLSLKRIIGDGISPELYSLYLACAGCKSRNLKSIMTWPQIDMAIKTLIESGRILNGYNLTMSVNPEMYFDIIKPEALARFNQVDVMTNYKRLIDDAVSFSALSKCIVNLYNPVAVKEINDKNFIKYPIDLGAF